MTIGGATGVLAAKVLLAAVFATASVAKLADLSGSRRSLVEFGVPVRLAPSLAMLLAVVELAAAVALALPFTARCGAATIFALSLVSGSAVASNMLRGRRPSCRCFGALHSAPIGAATLIRVGVLAVLAAVVVVESRPESVGVSRPDGAVMVALGLATTATVVVLRLRRTGSRIPDGVVQPPSIGSPAPEFSATDLSGRQVDLEQLRARGRPVALIFVQPRCGACEDLLPEIARRQRRQGDAATIVVVSERRRASRDMAAKHGLRDVLVQRRHTVADAYGVAGTPSAALVDVTGNLASPVVAGDVGVRVLLASSWEPAAL